MHPDRIAQALGLTLLLLAALAYTLIFRVAQRIAIPLDFCAPSQNSRRA